MLKFLLLSHIIVFGGLIGSTVGIELIRQAIINQYGENTISVKLETCYNTLCKVTGYACTPYYALFWKFPVFMINNFPKFIDKIIQVMMRIYHNILKPLIDSLNYYLNLMYDKIIDCLIWIHKNIIAPIYNQIIRFINKYIRLIYQFICDLSRWILNNFIIPLFNRFIDIITSLVNWIRDVCLTTLKNIWTFMKSGWNWLRDFLYKFVWTPIYNVCYSISQIIYNVYLSFSQTISNIIITSYNTVVNIVVKTYDSITTSISNIYQTMCDTFNHIIGYKLVNNEPSLKTD